MVFVSINFCVVGVQPSDCPPVTRLIPNQSSGGGTAVPLANELNECLVVSSCGVLIRVNVSI